MRWFVLLVALAAGSGAFAQEDLYRQASEAFKAKRFVEAAKLFGTVIEQAKEPDVLEGAYWNRASAYYVERAYDRAQKDYAEIIRRFPKSERAEEAKLLERRCRVYLANDQLGRIRSAEAAGDFVLAEKESGAFLKEWSEFEQARDVLYLQAELILKQGRTNDAMHVWNEFVRKYPNDEKAVTAEYNSGCMALVLEKDALAEKHFKAVAPKMPEAVEQLAWLMHRTGRPAEAAEYFAECAERTGRKLDYLNQAARIYADQKDYERAAQIYEKMAVVVPAQADRAWYQAAALRARLNQDEAVRRHYRSIIDFKGGSVYRPEAAWRLGKALMAEKNYKDAVMLFRIAGENTGAITAEDAVWNEAECCRILGDNAAAARTYGRLAKIWVNSRRLYPALLNQADLLRADDNVKDAEAIYRKVASDTKDSAFTAHAWLGIGHCLVAGEEWREAEEAFLKVDVLFAEDKYKPEALKMLALIAAKQSKPEVAARYLEELKRRYPEAK